MTKVVTNEPPSKILVLAITRLPDPHCVETIEEPGMTLHLTPAEHALLKSLMLGYTVKESAERVGRMLGVPMRIGIAHDHLRKARERGDYATLYQLVAATARATHILPPDPVPLGCPPGGGLTTFANAAQRKNALRRRKQTAH
jgi:hypothetical protein